MGLDGYAWYAFFLPSRDLIADSMETVMGAMSYDAMVTVVGCDKNMPGALMAMLRLNRPSVLLYGGTIAAGCLNDKIPTSCLLEAWGQSCWLDYEKEFKQWSKMPVLVLVLVGVCTLPIPWLPLSRHWGCRCHTVRPIQQ